MVKNLPPDFQTGVYCGWASVKDGEVHKMVMSVGWNPFYNNQEKSMVGYTNLPIGKKTNSLTHSSRKRISYTNSRSPTCTIAS